MVFWETVLWAAAVSGIFGAATLFAEKLISKQNTENIALLFHVRDDGTWVQYFLRAFDAIFTEHDFSLSRLIRSILATSLGIVLLWILLGPILDILGVRTESQISLGIALSWGLAINFVADFLSLAETRWLLNKFRYVRSLWGHLALLVADVIFTACVIYIAITFVRLSNQQPLLHPIELVVGYSAFAIFFYSTFITSVWAWVYALAILLTRLLSSRFVERISNFEAPFAWLAAVVTVIVFVLLVSADTLRRHLPENLDSRFCDIFGGISCLHAARLSQYAWDKVELLNSACDQRQAKACRNLGVMYANGDDLDQDKSRARELYTLACNAGDIWACGQLGYYHTWGVGGGTNLKKANNFYNRACDAGEKRACDELEEFQQYGFVATEDYAETQGHAQSQGQTQAADFYVRACNAGQTWACSMLSDFSHSEGDNRLQDLYKARELFSRSCEVGNTSSCSALARFYEEGIGVAKDPYRAAELFSRACDAGEAKACGELGYLYYVGVGVSLDISHARELYTLACNGGANWACNSLGFLYEQGLSVKKDLNHAREIYSHACDEGEMWACGNLGNFYAKAIGVAKDHSRARRLYQHACEGGEMWPCGALGDFYFEGVGVAEDKARARNLYKLACDGGQMMACHNLENLSFTE